MCYDNVMTNTDETITPAEHSIRIPTDQYGRVGGEQVIRLMSRMVNSPTASAAEDFAVAFMGEHRTLQQQMVASMLSALNALANASKEGRTDPRNEFAGKLAEQIQTVLIDNGVYVAATGEVRLPLI